ncbi:MAG: anthranilate phosphoribosyltransferase [Actinobacteria bacterium]|nr:anthranilate phosphoribosyltransferase [Actinomycetota bacterium]
MDEPTWPGLISELIARHDLGVEQTAWAMDQVMSGNTAPATLAGFLTALATKGETVAELRGLADSMLAHAQVIELPTETLDIVGTGGDRARTVNISSMAALVLAGAGIPVVKHGNRASSSASGSADLIEALGVSLTMPVEKVEEALGAVGITFLFANLFHPSMRFAAPTRRELGVATAFNVLGPLTNPGRPRSNAIGVSSARHAPLVAGVLAERGNSALVFRGRNGLDELTTTAVNEVWVVAGGEVRQAEFDATRLGLPASTVDDLRGADPAHNAAVAREVLAGAEGIVPDAVALNAAAGMVAHGLDGTREGTLEDRLAGGLSIAREVLRTGRAQDVLERWVAFSRSAG